MLPEESITLCRICLADDGAQFPIFDEGDDNIYQKLSTCLQEKVNLGTNKHYVSSIVTIIQILLGTSHCSY